MPDQTSQLDSWTRKIIDEFRANNGTVVHTARFGKGLVLIHHIGAKSGIERIAPAMSIHDDKDTWLVSASKAGAPENPAWYHNLVAHPDVTIEVADEGSVPVHVEELHGAERDTAWARFTAMSPGFRQYEQMTRRRIPVLVLRRRRPADRIGA